MLSIPGRYRPVGIASAVLGCGLVVHGFFRLYSIQIAATAALFNLEVSSGALLMMVGGIFLARNDSGVPIPVILKWGAGKALLLALTVAIMVLGGMVLLVNLR
jgi:hypothetical protein